MLQVYPAIVHNDADGCWIEFPDLEGCQSSGDTLEEAMESAQEALGLYLATLAEDGRAIPKPSELSALPASDGQAAYISTNMSAYRRDTRAVKKMLSIPAWLAKEAEDRNISLSKFLQDALKEQLHLA